MGPLAAARHVALASCIVASPYGGKAGISVVKCDRRKGSRWM